MRCAVCGSGYHGDAGNGNRRVRHSLRPSCAPSATYRAERYEGQVAATLARIKLSEADIEQVLAVMRRASSAPVEEPAADSQEARAELQRRLAAGEVSLAAFTREWRRLERPQGHRDAHQAVDELRLRRAARQLRGFGELWANPAVPDELRQEAAHELFERIDVDGAEVVALHSRPNENAWLLGFAGARAGMLTTQHGVGMVGARGLAAPVACRSVAAEWSSPAA